jgi:hypothetical protein
MIFIYSNRQDKLELNIGRYNYKDGCNGNYIFVTFDLIEVLKKEMERYF